jgi:ribonucleotide reductase beta subunit family protein with ferritin-like domain
MLSLHLNQVVICLVRSLLNNPLPQARVQAIIHEAVEIEKEFVCDALSCSLVGMNADLMSEYIEFVSDRLLVRFVGSCRLIL